MQMQCECKKNAFTVYRWTLEVWNKTYKSWATQTTTCPYISVNESILTYASARIRTKTKRSVGENFEKAEQKYIEEDLDKESFQRYKAKYLYWSSRILWPHLIGIPNLRRPEIFDHLLQEANALQINPSSSAR